MRLRSPCESRELLIEPRLMSCAVMVPFLICLPVMSVAAVAELAPTMSATARQAKMDFRKSVSSRNRFHPRLPRQGLTRGIGAVP